MSTSTTAETIQATTIQVLAMGFKMAVNKGTTVIGASSTMTAASAIKLERLLPQTRLSNELGKVNNKSNASPRFTRTKYYWPTTPRHSGVFGLSAQTKATIESPETGHQ